MWKQDESGRVHTPLEAGRPRSDAGPHSSSDPRGGCDHARVATLRGNGELDHLGDLRGRAGCRAHIRPSEASRITCALAGRSDRLPHRAAPEPGAFLAAACRFIRLARFGVIISRALQAEKRLTSGDSLRIAALLTLAAVVLAGAAQHAVDAGEFGSLWDGVWWAVVTATTVGYGDLYPKTVQGRLIGIVLMFTGIAFLSLLTASVASLFVKQERMDEHAELMEALQRIEADVADLKSRL
jgi:Ion channel